MKLSTAAFTDPTFYEASLDEIRLDYLANLKARTKSPSAGTVLKYDATLRSFFESLRRHNEPLILGALTKPNVDHWVIDQREAGLSDHTIASRLGILKVFTRKYLYWEMRLTHADLLERISNAPPEDKPRKGLTEQEREKILDCFDEPTYGDTRNRAIMAVTMATGLRFQEVMELPLSSYDRLHGELTVVGKGNKTRTARLSPRALKYVREYLRERPASETDRFWVTAAGHPMTYQGAYSIIRRVRARSGVKRLTWHLFRHSFAQHALQAGAHQGLVQDFLGHSTPAMTRKYLGAVKQQEAARQMPQFSPI